LRSTGTLLTGNVVIDGNPVNQQFPYGADGSFYLMPNPYQAQVDLDQVLNGVNTEDINGMTFYAWLPSTSNYVAYDLTAGGLQNSVSQFIQPGQSYFVATDAASGSLPGYTPFVTYTESMKSDAVATTATYSRPEAQFTIELYDADRVGGPVANDVIRGFINTGFNNGIDTGDAVKFFGLREQLAIQSNAQLLSNERRDHFTDGEILPLGIYQMENGTYTLDLRFTGMTRTTIHLVDNHLNTTTAIPQDADFAYAFDVDQADASSHAADRFYIEFTMGTLSSGDVAFAKAVQLYPNPVSNDVLNITGLGTGKTGVAITSLLGQQISDEEFTPQGGVIQLTGLSRLPSGVYLVRLSQDGNSTTRRVIVE
jgi:hypothetical protein